MQANPRETGRTAGNPSKARANPSEYCKDGKTQEKLHRRESEQTHDNCKSPTFPFGRLLALRNCKDSKESEQTLPEFAKTTKNPRKPTRTFRHWFTNRKPIKREVLTHFLNPIKIGNLTPAQKWLFQHKVCIKNSVWGSIWRALGGCWLWVSVWVLAAGCSSSCSTTRNTTKRKRASNSCGIICNTKCNPTGNTMKRVAVPVALHYMKNFREQHEA